MTILATESFTGANANPIGGNWTTMTGCTAEQRLSNSIRGTSGTSAAYYNAVTPPNDQYSAFIFGSFDVDSGPMARCATGTQDAYMAYFNNSTIRLYIFFSSGYTALSPGVAYVPSPGDRIEIRCIGTTISSWVNGVQKESAVDATYSSGRFGIQALGDTNFTSFEGGDFLSVAAGLVFKPWMRAGVGPNRARVGSNFAFMGSQYVPPAPAYLDPLIFGGAL